MDILILVNGELHNPDILLHRIKSEIFDLIIGADGGANHAKTLDVTVDAVIGDLDSYISDTETGKHKPELISYPAEKDEIDLELALQYAEEQGADRIVIIGAMGGRMDMTIANILLLSNTNFASCRIEVWHGEQTGWLIKPPGGTLPGKQGDTISLIPVGGLAEGVTLTGMKYPLENATLTIGMPRGVSNLVEKQPAHVVLSEGLLFAVHTPSQREGR